MKSDFFSGKGRRGKALVSVQRIYPVAAFCVGGQSPELEKPKKSWIAFFSPSLVSLYNKCPPPELALCGVYLVVLWWENLVFKLSLERR